MIAFGTSDAPPVLTSLGEPFRHVDFSDLPPVEKIPASHGTPIAFRVWREKPPSPDPALVVIAIHGSSAQSASIHPLGKALSAAGIPVYAPDIRGHGATGTRGDIDYAGQLDDDLADFVGGVHDRHPNGKFVLLGFSSGGGYALHAAASPLGKMFVRTVLLAPTLGIDAPTFKPDQRYARPFIPRIIALLLLDRVGIHAFDHLTTLLLAIDPARTDILTGHYSWLLTRAFGTSGYAADLRNAQTSLAVVVGEKDELFTAEKFAPTVDAIKPATPVTVVPGLSHTELTTDPAPFRRSPPPCAARISADGPRPTSLLRFTLKRCGNTCNGGGVAVKLSDQDFKNVVNCRDGSGNVIQCLGNIVLRVVVSLRWNERASDADWPADAVSTRHRIFSLGSLNLLRQTQEEAAARTVLRREHANAGTAADEIDAIEQVDDV